MAAHAYVSFHRSGSEAKEDQEATAMLGPQTESQAGVGHTRLCLQKEGTRRGTVNQGLALPSSLFCILFQLSNLSKGKTFIIPLYYCH